MKKTILVWLLWFMALSLKAQDSSYIQDFSHKINTKIGLDTNIFSYKVTNTANNSFYQLKPNESVRLTGSFQYRFLGLTVGFSPKFLNNSKGETLKGESDISSINLRLFIKRFVQEIEYYRIQGFYIENSADYLSNWVEGETSYIQLQNLKLKRFGGKTSFVWNKNFSYKALVVQNQKQLKSAGSFIPSISYFYSELTNTQNSFIEADESNFDLNLNAGYIHNFVFGKNHNFYTSLGLSPGFGIKFATTMEKTSNNQTEKKRKTHPNFNFEGRLNLGYNSDTIFTGAQFNAFGITYNKTPETKVEDSSTYFQIFFGYRFGAPKPIKRFFDKIHTKK